MPMHDGTTTAMHFQGDFMFSDVIRHGARFSPRHPAVICGNTVLTWSELELETRKAANALMDAGIVKGDKIGLLLPNGIPAFVAYWGAVRMGAATAAISPLNAGDALAAMLNNSESKLLFTDQAGLELLKPKMAELEILTASDILVFGASQGLRDAQVFINAGRLDEVDVPVSGNDTINIVYSSGSTGTPKGIEVSHLARHHYTFGMPVHFGMGPFSVALVSTPFYTNGTWAMLSAAMFRGATLVLMPKFSSTAFLEAVQRWRCTHSFMVPTQLSRIIADPNLASYDTSSLKVIESAGQKLMEAARKKAEDALPYTAIWEVYGTSEGFATVIGPEDRERGKTESVGRPMMLDDIRIVGPDGEELPTGEIGEICAYGIGLMKGYYRAPEKTAEQVWIGPRVRTFTRSGDLGYLDADGYLYLSGRLKDMIKSGGLNVFPSDIEQVLSGHPSVREACVVGVPHAEWVETPFAYVILADGAAETADELTAWVNERVGKFQRIAGSHIMPDFPRVAYGKVDKPALRKLFSTLGLGPY
ncbi:acyl-CoA synthetase (AMP-forming)/AMP-acid ligase II [Rhizobium aquaticum]|uniref:Acyl-CoA synthetase (AMP-forming)/AMP-acid ligase II n=1 Tax=Rhizobium aquaticum TaxID=1549636 RepID=A0ABV2J677_9HYPH